MTDVLIVGGGSAGSVLAERLSVDPACRVTLLESGPGFDAPQIAALTTAAAVLPIGADSPVARHYRSTLTGHPQRTADIVRGDCLGGSGSVNGGYFCRALPRDFEDMPAGWSWAEVLEHYRAVEARIPARPVARFGSVTSVFAEAAQRAGHRWMPELGSDANGLAAVPLNIEAGVRIGPGRAFLEPALRRPNLTVRTRARVTRVRMAGGRVCGVETVGPDGPVVVAAERVVLCAGAIATAQLLMLSGIGPAGELRALGIATVVDLPVGQRSRDHPEWVLPTGGTAGDTGPVLEAVLVADGLEIRPYTHWPTVGVALMRPRAHGRVSLNSADPADPPRIEHRYDSEPDDVADLRHGRDIVTGILGGTTELGDPEWSTSQHLCGTAPMGSDQDSVVDPRCRVHGVDGLWVVDGSVLPAIPSRGPHETITMIAHRAAEFLR